MPERFLPSGLVSDPRRARRIYRSQNAIWIWLGIAAFVGAIAFFLDPATADDSSAGRLLSGGIEQFYYGMLGVGGVVISYGVWRLDPRAEIIGHLFVGVSVFITGLAIVFNLGAVVSGLTLLGIGIANAFRIYYLWTVAPKRSDVTP